MKPLQYDSDHMPKEVATEMLLSKTKLTPAIRRACKLARQRMLPSIAPVHKGAGGYAYDMTHMAKVSSEKLASKYQSLSLVSLVKFLRRTIAARRATQFAYTRAKSDKERGALEMTAARCDEQRDALEFELKRRHNRK